MRPLWNVVFAHPRHPYPSYSDYRALARISGFKTVFHDQVDPGSDAIYIVSPVNREWILHVERLGRRWARRRCAAVYWSIERPDSGPGRVMDLRGTMVSNFWKDVLAWGYADFAWVADRLLEEPGAVHVPLAGDPRLRPPDSIWSRLMAPLQRRPKWDLCFLGYENGRRREILGRLAALGISVAPSGWGRVRHRALTRSRAMVVVHQTPCPVVEPQRFALAASYGIPVLSERLEDPRPLRPGIDYLEAPYDEIPRMVMEWLSRDLAPFGRSLRERLAVGTDFRREVLRGVWQSLESR